MIDAGELPLMQSVGKSSVMPYALTRIPSEDSVSANPSSDAGAVNSIFVSSYDEHVTLHSKEKSPFFA